MTMITPSYLGETIEYSSLHACRSTLEDPTPEDIRRKLVDGKQYAKARAVRPAVWTEEVKKLPRAWQHDVMDA